MQNTKTSPDGPMQGDRGRESEHSRGDELSNPVQIVLLLLWYTFCWSPSALYSEWDDLSSVSGPFYNLKKVFIFAPEDSEDSV